MTGALQPTLPPGHPSGARVAVTRAAELQLLNAFALTCEGEPVPLPLPAQRILAFVALLDRPVLRSAAASRLWLDCTETHALGSLRSALWRIRREGVELVDCSHHQLQLFPEVAVDVHELAEWSRRQVDGPAEDGDDGYVRHPGELLPDWYDDWVVLERERIRELRVRALESRCDWLTGLGEYGPANEAARAAIRDDPLRESAHRCLLRIHIAEGNDAEAIRSYRLFRKLLHDGLGLEPSSRMTEMIGTVMAQ